MKTNSDRNDTISRTARQRPDSRRTFDVPMLLIIGYLVVEYLRPPFIDAIHPALILQILFVIWFLLRWNKLVIVLKDTYFKLFFALMALMTVQVFTAFNNYWALMQWQVVLTYLVFGIAFCLFVDTPERLKAAISAFILFHAICAVNRLLGLPYFGVTGPMGDTNDFALAMNVAMPLSFFVGLHHSGKKRWLYWFFCFLFVAANVKCASRGGVVGMAAVSLIIVGFSRYKIKASIVLLILLVIFWALVPTSFKSEVFSIEEEGAEAGTGQERVELWKIAWRGFLDNPVFGVGQGNMPLLMPKYQYDREGKSFFHREIWFRSVHSVFFTALPEMGSVGFGLWVWMLVNMYRKFKVMKSVGTEAATEQEDPIMLENRAYIRQVSFGMIISIFGFLVTGIFLSAFYYPSLWTLCAMITTGYLIGNKITRLS